MSHFTVIRRINFVLTQLVGLTLIGGGLATAAQPPVLTGTVIAVLLGSKTSLVLFGIIFVLLGMLLMFASLHKRKKLYSRTLMVIYLACIFTALLELAIVPGSLSWIDNSVIAGICGYLWIWWKRTTEYIDLRHFHKKSNRIKYE